MPYPPKPATALLGEAGERLLARLAEGYPARRACALAGVKFDTLRYWLLKGADPGSRSPRVCPAEIVVEPFWSFARAYRAAEAAGRRRSPPGPRRGRLPSDITPAQETVIVAALRAGWSYHDACRHAEVRLSTFLSWLRLGGYPRRLTVCRPLDPAFVAEPYRSFAQAVQAAEEAALAPQDPAPG